MTTPNKTGLIAVSAPLGANSRIAIRLRHIGPQIIIALRRVEFLTACAK